MRAILTYHSIDDSGSPISVRPRAFARHVRFLASGAVPVVALDALARGEGGAHALALTFDDGFASFETAAWPLLEQAGLPVTLFVVAGHAGRTNRWAGEAGGAVPELPLLDWPALARLAGSGVRLGGHSLTHPHLDRLADAAVEQEIAGCRAEIERRTGVAPAAFAYPFGDYDARVAAAARRYFSCAVTTELAVLDAAPDAWRLPRLDAYYLQAPNRLESYGTSGFGRYVGWRRALRRMRAAFRR
jgi:peptidoglycan/xylan/chitin deacetylase (PgdA/CDA1 family)